MEGIDPPRGFAFAWFKIGNANIGVYSVHLKSNLISAKPVGVGAACQPWILGRTIWIADAHRGDGRRFIVRADEKLTAFVVLESAVQACSKFA